MGKSITFYLAVLFSCLVSIPIILPYFHAGYFPTHDGEWAVVRLGDMFRELKDLQFPARFSGNLNFGYGYPLFNFVYPFPYYLGTVMHFFGFGFVNSIKILFAASVFLSAFFMFIASRNLWKNTWAGFVSAIMYVYLPYRMVDLYVRGSIGESLSFVLFPLLFYLTIKLIEKPSYLWVSLTAISISILITTHNIMTVLFLPVLTLFIISKIIFEKKKEEKKPILLSIVLGLGISAFFWLPALLEKQYIILSKIPITDRNLYFVRLDQFLFPKWGYGVPTDPNGFSYQLGLPHLIILVLAIFVLLLTIRHSGEHKRLQNLGPAFLLIVVILIFIFLLFRPSAFLWEHVPFLSEINYPWTALGILGFLTSLLAGFLCRQKITRYIVVALSLVAVALVLPYAKPQSYISRNDQYYLTNEATTTSSNELMPLWVKKIPTQRFENKVELIEGKGEIKNLKYNSKSVVFSMSSSTNSKLRINTIYYPGWKVSINDKNVPVSYVNERGVIEITVPSGKHIVEARFTETPIRLASNGISLLSLLALLFLGIRGYKSPSVY